MIAAPPIGSRLSINAVVRIIISAVVALPCMMPTPVDLLLLLLFLLFLFLF